MQSYFCFVCFQNCRYDYALRCGKRHDAADAAAGLSGSRYIAAYLTLMAQLLILLCFIQVPGTSTPSPMGIGLWLQIRQQDPHGMLLCSVHALCWGVCSIYSALYHPLVIESCFLQVLRNPSILPYRKRHATADETESLSSRSRNIYIWGTALRVFTATSHSWFDFSHYFASFKFQEHLYPTL